MMCITMHQCILCKFIQTKLLHTSILQVLAQVKVVPDIKSLDSNSSCNYPLDADPCGWIQVDTQWATISS